jgi:hypothetical protein
MGIQISFGSESLRTLIAFVGTNISMDSEMDLKITLDFKAQLTNMALKLSIVAMHSFVAV